MSRPPLPRSIPLRQHAGGVDVAATITRLTLSLATEIDKMWWQGVPGKLKLQPYAYDSHWKWVDLLRLATDPPDPSDAGMLDAICVQTTGGDIEGAAVFRVNFESLLKPGRPAIGLEFVASAPWNRPVLTANPRFKGVGSALVCHAVHTGHLLGLEGVTVAAAIDSEEALRFYLRKGFVDTGRRTEDSLSLPYWELPPVAAQAWLKAEGLIR